MSKSKLIFYIKALLCTSFFIMSLAGCTGLNLSPGTPELDVRQAAEDYWRARVAGDWVVCYKYEEASKLGKVRLSDYVQSQGSLIYKSAEIDGIEILAPDKAKVHVSIEYYLPAFGTSQAFKSNISETWLKIDGKWYHHKTKKLAER